MYKNMIIGFVVFTFIGTVIAETIDTVVVTDAPGADTVKVVETKVETVKVAEIKGDTATTKSEGESGTVKSEGTSETTTSEGTSETQYASESTGSSQQVQASTGEYKVQLGAFQVKENADSFYSALKTQFGDAFYIENTGTYWKVGAGTYSTGKSAVAARKTFVSQGYGDAFITH